MSSKVPASSLGNGELLALAGLALAGTLIGTYVYSKSGKKVYAGVEAGGTSFTVALADSSDITVLIARATFETTTPQETLARIVAWLRDQCHTHNLAAIGIASFGPIELDKASPAYGNITTTPKPKWANARIVEAFKEFKVPIGFDTDVNAAAISEYAIGNHSSSTRKIKSTAYITVGTGVGVGIVVDGQPVHGLVHPEAGHMLVPRATGDETFAGTCPYHKECLEGFVAIGALVSRLSINHTQLPQTLDDDPVWDKIAHYLGVLCANLVLTVSPSVIVLGGGVMNRAILYEKVQQKTRSLLNNYISNPALSAENIKTYIVRSRFANNSGIVGALELARLAHK